MRSQRVDTTDQLILNYLDFYDFEQIRIFSEPWFPHLWMGTVIGPPGEEAGGSYVAVLWKMPSAEQGMQRNTPHMLALTVGHDTHYTVVWNVIKFESDQLS